jgi:hypothetical protein
VKFEVFTAVTMKNGVFWVVTPCCSCKNFFAAYVGFLRSVRRLLVAACVVPSSPIFVTLMKEAPGFPETSVLTRATRRNNPEDNILHDHSIIRIFVFDALAGAVVFLTRCHISMSLYWFQEVCGILNLKGS